MTEPESVASQPLAQTHRDFFIGAEVGGYRITAKLGEGAMGTVYRGEHSVLGRPAAIKFLNADLAAEPELVSRFFTEAKAVNGIRHPNIVDITDFGQRGQRYFYVMELLEGQTVLERLELEGRAPTEVALRVGMQAASALAAAHDKGIVHRDLKPDNIFLCNHPDYPDYVKVFDFGIAKLIANGPGAEGHKTRAGSMLGTPFYMSPEQCLGEESLDHRSDIYSLGVVLYKMVTGVVPFDGSTLSEIIMGHISNEPPLPRAHNEAIPESLEAIILRALAKDRDDRFADMREMRAALQACDPASVQQMAPVSESPAAGRKATKVDADQEEEVSEKLVGELITIILERIEKDRLVLPAMPASALQAIKALDNPNVTFHSIAKIIADDPVLAPQLYRRASSAQFGNAEAPRTVEQAISRLGMSQLKSVLVELSAHQVYDSRNRKIRKAFKGIWDHTVAVANAAKEIATIADLGVEPEMAHLAGLMHDVGKPIVGALLLEAEKMLGMKKKDWITAETFSRVVEESHRRVGTALAKKWQLPEEIIAVIAGGDSYSQEEGDACSNIIRFSNAFAKRCGKACGEFDEDAVEEIVSDGVDLLGLDWVFVHDALREKILNAGNSNSAEGANSTQALVG